VLHQSPHLGAALDRRPEGVRVHASRRTGNLADDLLRCHTVTQEDWQADHPLVADGRSTDSPAVRHRYLQRDHRVPREVGVLDRFLGEHEHLLRRDADRFQVSNEPLVLAAG
jgi:hypothetical protein